ncbi:uncharacterized protein LOC123663542 [Melitaea cinxia]|uniref:uncharacterized protein LOC123663542 n=1 Tax=Melitaea cinxia TaxID=113334 RepID=UPI001E27427C|nr:uncharacterized protein LOC123663542 [Melitaea cinxia]
MREYSYTSRSVVNPYRSVNMKVVLVLFPLILLVYADVNSAASANSAVAVDQLPADSVYDTILTDYLGSSKQQSSTKKIIKSKISSKSQGTLVKTSINHVTKKPTKIITNKRSKFAYDKYDNYLKYQGIYKAEYSRLVGRKGLGYDKRIATSHGLRAPLTPERLEVVGQKKGSYKNDLYPIF